MQHFTGVNPSEAAHNESKSSTWKFIYRGADYPNLPEAFVPHCSYLTWISSPQGRSGKFLLRGYVQFVNRRNYYTMKHRYSVQAEWIAVPANDKRYANEFAVDPIPANATRHVHGNPLTNGAVNMETPLPKVGYNISVPDLTEDYRMLLWANEYPEEPLPPPRKRTLEAVPDLTPPSDYVTRNPYTGEEICGRYKGHYWHVDYSNKKKRIL